MFRARAPSCYLSSLCCCPTSCHPDAKNLAMYYRRCDSDMLRGYERLVDQHSVLTHSRPRKSKYLSSTPLQRTGQRSPCLIRHRIPPARNIKSTGKQISFFRISVQVLITRSTVMQIFTLLMISPFSHIVRRHSFHRTPLFLSPSVQIVSMRCSFPCYENGYSFL